MKSMIKQSLMTCLVLVLLCGLIYPLAMTGLGNLLFFKQASGSMVSVNGSVTGSELIGQDFTGAGYFHGRVSSIHYNTYDNASAGNHAVVTSGSSNLAPSNKKLTDRITDDTDAFIKDNPTVKRSDIPADLVTNSGSGLDPDISASAALIQIPRIAKATKLSSNELKKIVAQNTSKRTLGILGEERVNVLKCNIMIANRLK